MMAPDYHAQPVRFSAPGIGHGQVDGSPREGGAAVRNGVPVVSLHLGEGDGQPVLEVSDPQYLSQLISAAVVAHGRLAMFPARTAPAACGPAWPARAAMILTAAMARAPPRPAPAR
jgi:hypothetical protein